MLPYAWSVADQVPAEWVMDARCEDMAKSMRGLDAVEPSDGEGPRSKVNVAPALTEPGVVPSENEQPAPPSTAPSTDIAGPVQ